MRRSRSQIAAERLRASLLGERAFYAVFAGTGRFPVYSDRSEVFARAYMARFEAGCSFVLRKWVPGHGFDDIETFGAV
jgi:hypothetical protein